MNTKLFIGYLAAFLTAIAFLPTVYLVYKKKQVKGI